MLDSADDPTAGPWATQTWDLCLDLGAASPSSYRKWSDQLSCPVQAVRRLEQSDFEKIRDGLNRGSTVLVDQYGLDWWDLISFEFHRQLEEIARLQSVVEKLDSRDEIFITRPGFQSRVLSLLRARDVHCFPAPTGSRNLLRHYAGVASRLSVPELLQILGDKYDNGYRFRRFFAGLPKTTERPVVLLPSAYVNVSRAELQYAEMLPESDFLLVATRYSALIVPVLKNVAVAKLASFARRDKSLHEFELLLARWRQLQPDLMHHEILSVLIRTGALNSFPKLLREGLMIRDAWLEVFRQQPICAVLCADDANLPTRIPLMIAARRGLPAISCHHGALDGRYRMRRKPESLFLAKGRMERDYLVSECGIEAENIDIGGPAMARVRPARPQKQKSVVFFSEPYEIFGGRCREMYREVLPPLAELAASTGRDLVLKLHPMESARQRTSFASDVISTPHRRLLQVLSGPLQDELLAQAWFAATIASTTAVDCTLKGVPMFLCNWLDYSPYGYARQFAKFGAGIALGSAEEIRNIPAMLQSFRPKNNGDLWRTIAADRLSALVGQPLSMAAAV